MQYGINPSAARYRPHREVGASPSLASRATKQCCETECIPLRFLSQPIVTLLRLLWMNMVDYRTMQRAIREAERDWDALERFYRRSRLHPRVELPNHAEAEQDVDRQWLSITASRTR